MASAKERRKVARKMREMVIDDVVFFDDILAEIIGVDYDNDNGCWNRLADLIDPGEDVSMSAYDLLSEDDRDALAWVRGHGGLDEIRRQRRDSVPRAAYERNLAKRQRQVDESHAALRRRNERIAELEHERGELYEMVRSLNAQTDEMEKRLMPEGMEWPRFDDLEPVRIGDDFMDMHGRVHTVASVRLKECGEFSLVGTDRWGQSFPAGSRVGRPGAAPKALDADGVEIREGDVLYRKSDGHMVKVAEVYEKTFTDADDYVRPGEGFTHRAPVFAADCRPLQEGEHVYHVETGAELVVKELPRPGEYQAVVVFTPPASHLTSFDPDQLTHERPDSWEWLEEDVAGTSCPDVYCANHHIDASDTSYEWAMARDIVRRARALAGRDA